MQHKVLADAAAEDVVLLNRPGRDTDRARLWTIQPEIPGRAALPCFTQAMAPLLSSIPMRPRSPP